MDQPLCPLGIVFIFLLVTNGYQNNVILLSENIICRWAHQRLPTFLPPLPGRLCRNTASMRPAKRLSTRSPGYLQESSVTVELLLMRWPRVNRHRSFSRRRTAEQILQQSRMPVYGCLGEVDDITGVISFLASDDARWITGQTIHANGGVS